MTFTEFREIVLAAVSAGGGPNGDKAERWLVGCTENGEVSLSTLSDLDAHGLEEALHGTSIQQAVRILPALFRAGHHEMPGVVADFSDGEHHQTWIAERVADAILGAWQLLPPSNRALPCLLHETMRHHLAGKR